MIALKKTSFPKLLVQLLLLLFLTYAIAVGVTLANRSQDIRKEASVPDGVASVSIEPSKGNYSVGDVIESKIYFDTGGVAMSAVAVRLTTPFRGSTPQISVHDVIVNPEFPASSDWVCPTAVPHIQDNQIVIDIACANIRAGGYRTFNNVLLATVELKINSAPATNPVTLRFDPSWSMITRYVDNTDILLIPTSTASYKITPPNRFCNLNLTPTSASISPGSNVELSAEVTGRKVTSVRFTSPDNSLLFELPKVSKQPYRTLMRLDSNSDYGSRDTFVYAKAYLGNNVLCEDSAFIMMYNPSPTAAY